MTQKVDIEGLKSKNHASLMLFNFPNDSKGRHWGLKSKNHASLTLFDFLGAIRQISSESASNGVVMHRHALSA